MSAEETAVLSEPVLAERRGNVLLITLNRPEVRNAVNAALAAGVAGALDELDADEGLAVGVLTGETQPAERFHHFGVVNSLAEPGAAVEVALALAERLAKNGPLALAASKRILQEQFDWSSEEMWEKQGAISGPVFASEDAKEGANAFKEKREAVWRGR